MDRAGQYLRYYEKTRYSWMERNAPAIFVPPAAVEFPDESFWGGEIDFDKFASKTHAAIFRVGQGTWKDEQFERNYAEAKQRGLKVGAYHFYDGRVSPANQAEFVVSALKGKELEMELFADWERNYGMYDGLSNVVAFMRNVENRVRAKDIGLYSGYYWFVENSNANRNKAEFDYLRRKPFWIAWYASAAMVKVPAPFTNWTHWQYGTPAVGLDYGVEKIELDMNIYNGNAEQFAARYGELPRPKPELQRVVITGRDITVTVEE